jgi:hypothetical protein
MPLPIANKAAITTKAKTNTDIFQTPDLILPSQCPKIYAKTAAPRAGIIAGTSTAASKTN